MTFTNATASFTATLDNGATRLQGSAIGPAPLWLDSEQAARFIDRKMREGFKSSANPDSLVCNNERYVPCRTEFDSVDEFLEMCEGFAELDGPVELTHMPGRSCWVDAKGEVVLTYDD